MNPPDEIMNEISQDYSESFQMQGGVSEYMDSSAGDNKFPLHNHTVRGIAQIGGLRQ
jgi:hypothetical protein